VNVELISVGEELLVGAVLNTNAAWLGDRLAAAGYPVTGSTVVGDDPGGIAGAVRGALARAPVVVLTGGLGPTPDDATRDGLARAAGVACRADPQLVAALRQTYRRLGRQMAASNLRQAEIPDGATPIANPAGTAPGIRMALAGGVLYALPGVPHEMRAMVEASVLADLAASFPDRQAIETATVHTTGMSEARVAETLGRLPGGALPSDNPVLAYLAEAGCVRVRITARGDDRDAALAILEPVRRMVVAALGPAVYGYGTDTLPGVVHAALAERGETVAVAESMTGGGLAALLSETPGASQTFRGGLVVYATDTKSSLAGVPAPLLAAEGPVSAQVATALAAGARDRLAASYGLGLTGVAGPDAQDGVPPGTVYLALAGPATAQLRELRLPGDRARVRRYAATAALDLLRRHLVGSPAGSG
jgi:nicotinamide-nucleotide amidase